MRFIAILMLLFCFILIAMSINTTNVIATNTTNTTNTTSYPTNLTTSCTDVFCADTSLQIWGIGNCYNQICLQGLSRFSAVSCFNVLCDNYKGSLDSTCQLEICGEIIDNTITTSYVSPVLNGTLPINLIQGGEIDDLQTQVNSLSSKLDSARTEIYGLKKNVAEMQVLVNNLNSSQDNIMESFSPKSSLSFVYIFLGVMALGLVGFSTFNTLKINKLGGVKLKPGDKNKIRSYIQAYSARGYPYPSIKQGLLKQGWKEKQIEEARKL